ncbi:hypothetical protein GOP47_0027785 [Adiantum capillus-veneris]|nr:hypothetical protein GOP47_0027785 [Adiantum capillus-veneris]
MLTVNPSSTLRIHSRPGNNDYCSVGSFTRLVQVFPLILKRKEVQLRMLKGVHSMAPLPGVTGFGSQREGGKAKHKVLTLDPTKVEQVVTFDLFARRFSENEPSAKWEPIGEILLEKETDLEMALKERRKKLLAAAQHQYPSLLLLNAGEEVQYGYRKSGEESKDAEIIAVDVKGKEIETSIEAILRADDGVKPSPKKFQRN